MKKSIISLALGLIAGAGIGYYATKSMQPLSCGVGGIINESHCALRRGMDKLWIQHVLWTRQFIVSSLAGLKDIDASTQRLLQNQDDIGNAIAPYYGKEAGAQLAKLLREHIMIAADIVKAAVAKNNNAVTDLDLKWHKNASEIAQFLSAANPKNWSEKDLTAMLNEHLRVTTQELMLRIDQDWAQDITNFENVFDQAIMMGKELADGIVKQFPEKFKSN